MITLGLLAIGAGLAVGLAALGTGYAQANIGSAGAGAIAEKPEVTGTIILLVAIPETMVILGFAVAAMIILVLPRAGCNAVARTVLTAMSLEKILAALPEEARRQVVAIEQAAQAEIARIEEQARAAAEAEREKQRRAIQEPLQAEQARILNRGRQEALQTVLGVREQLIAAALEAAAHRLAQLADSEAYPPILRELIREATDALGRDTALCLRVRTCDVALAERLAAELGLAASVVAGLEDEASPWGCLGGVEASTSDGRIRLVNTLAARLQRAADLHRSRIAELLFGAGPEG